MPFRTKSHMLYTVFTDSRKGWVVLFKLQYVTSTLRLIYEKKYKMWYNIFHFCLNITLMLAFTIVGWGSWDRFLFWTAMMTHNSRIVFTYPFQHHYTLRTHYIIKIFIFILNWQITCPNFTSKICWFCRRNWWIIWCY